MNGPADHARGWLQKADSDLAGARRILEGPGPYDIVCFHAQQAAEKCLKAVLAPSGDPIPRIDELGDLADLARAAAPGLEVDVGKLPEIAPFAIELRYDLTFWPDREKACQAVATAEKVRDQVRRVLPPGTVP
jgi:HEPN domain-containing protein